MTSRRRGALIAPRKARFSPLTATMTGGDAFKALVEACLEHYRANERGMLEGEGPEYLHQMRVALRRMRAVFNAFQPLIPARALARPFAEARWLARELGPARDWDVFAHDTLPRIIPSHPHPAGTTAMVRRADRFRDAANRQAREAVTSARGRRLPALLADWLGAGNWQRGIRRAQSAGLAQPVTNHARTVLAAGQKRLLRRGRRFAELDAPQLHRVRIAAKAMRYATEFFAPLYDKRKVRGHRAKLAPLQDALGAYNDTTMAIRLTMLASHGVQGAAAEARGFLLGWSAAAQDSVMRKLRRRWKSFCAAPPFWE